MGRDFKAIIEEIHEKRNYILVNKKKEIIAEGCMFSISEIYDKSKGDKVYMEVFL
jgi:hypothetical protein